MLEGLILGKPTIHVILDDEFSEIIPLEYPIIQVNKMSDLKDKTEKIFNNDDFRKTLLQKILRELNKYLSYQNNSSSRILELFENYT